MRFRHFVIPSLTSSGWSGLYCDEVARWEADHTKLDTAEGGPHRAPFVRAELRHIRSHFRSFSAKTPVKILATEAERNSDGSGDDRFFDGAHRP